MNDPLLPENDAAAASACARMALLPDYWLGALPDAEAARVREHLAGCADCAGLDRCWQALGELPEVQPDAAQRRRFEQMLAGWQAASAAPHGSVPESVAGARIRGIFAGAWRGLARPAVAVAAAVCLAAGLAGGWLLRGARAGTAGAAGEQSREIAALRQEVHTTGELVVLSLLQQQSASDRLQGVDWSYRLPEPDPRVTDALLASLDNDSSPDVRLAALDALQQTAVSHQDALALALRRELVEAFQHQKSPLLQIALVDTFVDTHDTAARALLESVRNSAQYSPEVRQRAAWGLTHWN